MTDTTNTEQNRVAAGGRLERLVICFRWNWRWGAFWKVWGNEAKGVALMLWMGLVGIAGATVQAVMVVLFPLRWLLIDPLKTGLTCTAKQAENLAKVLGR